jgi:hypothetical protein
LIDGCRAFLLNFRWIKNGPSRGQVSRGGNGGQSGKAIRGTAHQQAKAVEVTQKFEESEVHLEFAASLLQGENALAEPNRHRM